ncbi:MAG: hypothetical protein DCC75_10410 [Proteobacteria bacterium]|nr:MAG: hypothetical protein DCC75_10410 [Pseudomonadota bacterium]
MRLGASRDKFALNCLFGKGRDSGLAALKRVKRARNSVAASLPLALVFAPGIFLLALGVCVLAAPQFVTLVLAILFLSLGLGAIILAVRLLELKGKLERMSQKIEARIMFVGPETPHPQDPANEQILKKVILH